MDDEKMNTVNNEETTTQKNTKLNKKLGMRLSDLLDEKGMTQKQLPDILKIKPNVISYYCSGTRRPKIEEYIEIADIFQVSLDYLLCASDIKSTRLSEGAVKLLRKCPPSYVNTITIEQSEYKELLIKAFLYNLLREEAPKAHKLSPVERGLLRKESKEE